MEQTKRNLSKYDKIIVELIDLQDIIDYVDAIPLEEREGGGEVLREGVLTVQRKSFPSTSIYFEVREGFIECEVYIGTTQDNTRLMGAFQFNSQTGKIETHGKWKEILKGNDVQKDLMGYVFWVTMVTLYMAHIGTDEVVEVQEERIKVIGKNRHKSKNTNRYTYITRKKYTLKAPSEELKQKRQVIRHVESWSVRGHFRKHPNGTLVWVKPHVKGNGEVKPKTYKVTP